MIDIFKFIVLFLYKTIISNPGKLIFGTISIMLWHFAGTVPDVKESLVVIDSLHINHNYQYVYGTTIDNKIVYKLYNSETPKKLANNRIELSNYNDANVVLWILFAIFGVVSTFIIVASLTNDRECSWDWDESFDYALSWFTKCYEEEKGIYYYYAFGKLLEKSPYHNDKLSIGSLRSLRMAPDYEPKKEKRDKIISKILEIKI